jgi:DHA3 family macrolide efflux protein-like MFS transporter
MDMDIQANQSTFKSYLAFFFGQHISLLGSSVVQFVIVWWITLETGSAWYLALASIAGFAPMILLTPFAGVWVDRYSRKLVIALFDFAQALSTVVLIFLFWYGIISIWLILSILIFRSCCQAFHQPAAGAIVPLMVPRNRLSRINGLEFVLNGVMTLLGPVIAALLLAFWSIDSILWIDPATFVIALIPLLLIVIPSVRIEQEKTSFKNEFIGGLSFIRAARGLVPLIFMATALNFLLTPMSTLLPYFVKFVHYGGATELAFVMASIQAGMFCGGILMTLAREIKRKMMVSAIFIFTCFVAYGIVAFSPVGLFVFLGACFFVMGFAIAPANVLFRTIIQTSVPANMLGRVNSVVSSLASMASPFGMAISGVVVGLTGTTNLFVGCAAVGAIVLLGAWFFTDLRHVENLEATMLSNVRAEVDAGHSNLPTEES